MKMYGYQVDSDEMIELNEVSIMSKVEELERLINFLQHVVENHTKVVRDTELCHSHFRDWEKNWNMSQPDIIVVTEGKK